MLLNLEDWENIIHFGNLFASIGKKTYFLAFGTIPETGVRFIMFIAGKNTAQQHNKYARLKCIWVDTYMQYALFFYGCKKILDLIFLYVL